MLISFWEPKCNWSSSGLPLNCDVCLDSIHSTGGCTASQQVLYKPTRTLCNSLLSIPFSNIQWLLEDTQHSPGYDYQDQTHPLTFKKKKKKKKALCEGLASDGNCWYSALRGTQVIWWSGTANHKLQFQEVRTKPPRFRYGWFSVI